MRQSLLDKLKLAVEITEKKLEWENHNPHLEKWFDGKDITAAIYCNRDIRIKDKWAELKAKKEANPDMVVEWKTPQMTKWAECEDVLWRPDLEYRKQPYWRERKAFKEGKKIEFRSLRYQEEGWSYAPTPAWNDERFEFRIAPEPEWIPLGPEDIPTGTLVRMNDSEEWEQDTKHEWSQILGAGLDGIFLAYFEVNENIPKVGVIPWKELMNHEILLPNTKEWKRCRKPSVD